MQKNWGVIFANGSLIADNKVLSNSDISPQMKESETLQQEIREVHFRLMNGVQNIEVFIIYDTLIVENKLLSNTNSSLRIKE